MYKIIITLFVSSIIGILFSYFILNFIVRICKVYGVVDTPDWRKVHTVAVPRLGGLVFLPSAAVALSVGMMSAKYFEVLDYSLGVSSCLMILGSIIIYVLGFIDDLMQIKARSKFIIQIIASLLLPLCNLRIYSMNGFLGIYEMPTIISYLFTVLVILVVVNAVNLIDGIDGLSSSLSILILSVLSSLFFQAEKFLYVLMCLSFIATLSVFFCFNVFGKIGGRKIFMGDAGSLTLGYVIAYLIIKYQMPLNNHEDETFKMLISYSLVIIPTFDVIRVAFCRKISGKQMFSPDKTHIHHKLMATGLTMKQTLIVILLFQIAFLAFNLVLVQLSLTLTWIVLLDIAIYTTIHIFLPVKND